MTNLPILRTEIYDGVNGGMVDEPTGPIVLTDSSDATSLRISTVNGTHIPGYPSRRWYLMFDDTDLAAATSMVITFRFTVISTTASAAIRLTLEMYDSGVDMDYGGFAGLTVSSDLITPGTTHEFSVTVDQAWMDAHAVFDSTTRNGYWLDSGLSTFAALRDGLIAGPNNELASHFRLWSSPTAYEIDIHEASVFAGGLPEPDFDGDTIPDTVDPDIDGDGTPNETDPDDFDPLIPAPEEPEPMFHFTRSIRSNAGTLRLGAAVEVRTPGTTDVVIVPLYSDAAGTTPMDPAFIAAEGVVDFYVDEPLIVDIAITPVGGSQVVLPNVWVGKTLEAIEAADGAHTHTAVEVGAIPSDDVDEIHTLTQAEYDALGTYDPDFLYVIREEV